MLLFQVVGAPFPTFPIEFSLNLVLTGLFVSVLTGMVSGFAPAGPPPGSIRWWRCAMNNASILTSPDAP